MRATQQSPVYLIAAAFVIFLVLNLKARAELNFPALTGFVVDQAEILDASSRAMLIQKLSSLEARSSDQLVVVTLTSLQGTSIENFGLRLFNYWHLGQKDKNNGVLLIVAPNERTVRIEVGYGLEDTLTNATARKIIEESIIPQFRANNFSGGIAGGVDAVIEVLAKAEVAPPAAPAENRSPSTTAPSVIAQNPAPPQAPSTATAPAQSRAETLPMRIGAFHEAFNHIAQRGTTDLLAEAARCGRGACFYQLTDLDGSVAIKATIAAGSPENNASSIELQASNSLAQNTLGAAVMTVVQLAAPQLSATARLHVMQSLFADMSSPRTIGAGGAACVDLVPGHWIISGYVFDYVVHIRIQWPSSSPRGQANSCRHLVPDDEVLAPDRYKPYKAQQTINDCERDAACWVRHYPEIPGWCLHALFNRGELEALSVTEANRIDDTPREARWADSQDWPVFAFIGRWAKRTQPQHLSPLIMVEYSCTYDPLAEQVLDVRLLPNSKPVIVPAPTVKDFLPRPAPNRGD